MVRRPSIIINRLDAERLQRLIDSATEKDLMVAQLLEEELARGEVLDPQDIPNDLRTMHRTAPPIPPRHDLKAIRHEA